MLNNRINHKTWQFFLIYTDPQAMFEPKENKQNTKPFPIVCHSGEKYDWDTEEELRVVVERLSAKYPHCTYVVTESDCVFGPDLYPDEFQVWLSMRELKKTLKDYESTNLSRDTNGTN